MRITQKALIILFLLFSFFVFSCKRVVVEKNSNPQRYADSQVVGLWKITAVQSDKPHDWDGNGTTETDVFSTWSECQKDNLYELVGTKTGTYKMSCTSTKSGTWLIEDALVLILNPEGGASQEETIISLTSNNFRTTSVNEPSAGNRFVITKVWTRQ
jgi:hypothetical protein